MALLLAACVASEPGGRVLVGATHTVEDSGLLDVLLAAYDSAVPGANVQVIVAGSGEILQYGRRGDLDVLLAHAPVDERRFVDEGFGADRRPVMWNEFVLLGPAGDPAGAARAADAVEAFRAVAGSRARFISRGDQSGTHQRELELWDAAGTRPAPAAYIEAGTGMADALRVASSQSAYILSDLATYSVLRSELDLAVAFRGDPRLLNGYSVITVVAARNPDGARRFADWITGPDAQRIIGAFGTDIGGDPLFHPGPPPAAARAGRTGRARRPRRPRHRSRLMRPDSLAKCSLACAVLFAAGPGGARAQQPQRPDCSAPEYRQFDFWVGEWDVTTPAGQPAGVNRITRILKDCVLLEEWTGAGGGTGRSYNTWSRSDGTWHQTYVDDAGTLLLLTGGLRNGAMVLEGETKGPGGAAIRNRITWSVVDGDADRVRQHWETSSDGGATWSTAFDGTYRRRR